MNHQRNKNVLDKVSGRCRARSCYSNRYGPLCEAPSHLRLRPPLPPLRSLISHALAPFQTSDKMEQARYDMRQRAGDDSMSTAASKAYYDAKEKARS
jgi:hypothetical protein